MTYVTDSGDEAAVDQVDASGEEGDAEADRQLGRAVKRPTGSNDATFDNFVTVIFYATFSDGARQLHPPNAGSCSGRLPEV